MERVLIDAFIVPEPARAAFLDQTRNVQTFVRTLPGFVEGYLYALDQGQTPYNFLTMVVWEHEEAFAKAQEVVASEYVRQGFDTTSSSVVVVCGGAEATNGRASWSG